MTLSEYKKYKSLFIRRPVCPTFADGVQPPLAVLTRQAEQANFFRHAGAWKVAFAIYCFLGSACGGAMKVIAFIEDPVVINQILDHLKHKAQASEPGALPGSRAPLIGLQ